MTLKSNLLIALTMLTVAPLVYSMQIIETAEYYEDYKGRRIPKTPDNNLMIAVKRSNDAGIKEAILNGANPDTTTTYSPLAYAIKKTNLNLRNGYLIITQIQTTIQGILVSMTLFQVHFKLLRIGKEQILSNCFRNILKNNSISES